MGSHVIPYNRGMFYQGGWKPWVECHGLRFRHSKFLMMMMMLMKM